MAADNNGNNFLNVVAFIATWVTSIFSWVTKENVTYLLATTVSVFAIINFIYSIRSHRLKIKKLKNQKDAE